MGSVVVVWVLVEASINPSVSDADIKHLRWLLDQLDDQLLDAVVITTE